MTACSAPSDCLAQNHKCSILVERVALVARSSNYENYCRRQLFLCTSRLGRSQTIGPSMCPSQRLKWTRSRLGLATSSRSCSGPARDPIVLAFARSSNAWPIDYDALLGTNFFIRSNIFSISSAVESPAGISSPERTSSSSPR